MSMALVKTKISEAVTAQEAADFAGAITKLRSAQLLLVAIPTRTRQGETEVAFEQDRITTLMSEMQRAQNAAQGIQRTKFHFKRPGS